MAFSNAVMAPLNAEFQPGGEALAAMNGINQNAIGTAQARYAPYASYADVASKLAYANYLPYQLQAQVLSNPMLYYAFKDNPEVLNSLMKNFTSSIPQPGQAMAGMNVPSPASSGSNSILGGLGGLLSKILPNSVNPLASLVGSSGQSNQGNNGLLQPPQPAQTSQSSDGTVAPLVPGMGGGMSGYIAKLTAPGTQSPYAPGALIPDPNNPGHVINVATSRMQTAMQTQGLAEKRVEPELDRLANEWSPFMDLKGHSSLLGARLGNFLSGSVDPGTLKSLGMSPNQDLPSMYAKALSTTKTIPEGMVKAYGLNPTNETLERLQDAIQPLIGESTIGYKNRIKQTLAELKSEQTAPTQQAMGQGFSVPGSPEAQSQATQTDNKNMVSLEGGLQVPSSFASRAAFEDWFKSQPKATQLAYREHLKGKM